MRRAVRGLAFGGLLALAILYDFLLHRQQWFPYRQLKSVFHKGKPEDLTRRFGPVAGASALAQRDAVGALMQIPYLSGYDPARGEVGVTVHDASRAYPGWNLCVSAHAAEARLTDMGATARGRGRGSIRCPAASSSASPTATHSSCPPTRAARSR